MRLCLALAAALPLAASYAGYLAPAHSLKRRFSVPHKNHPPPQLSAASGDVSASAAGPLLGQSGMINRPEPTWLGRSLYKIDNTLLDRVVRLANHAAAFASLSYFGLVSSAQMGMAGPPGVATLAGVLTKTVGPTTNQAFSAFFPTLVTPAPFVFFIWPVIAALQLLAVGASASGVAGAPPLKTSELSALTLANIAAAGWLLVSSNAAAGALPLGSLLLLPLVPLFAGHPLRSASPPKGAYAVVFQTFSSFTTIASFLALAVELQHGGRLPSIFSVPEVAACVFLSLVRTLISLPHNSRPRRAVNVLALTGILARRVAVATAAGGGGLGGLLLSVSFVGTAACWGWAVRKLARGGSE